MPAEPTPARSREEQIEALAGDFFEAPGFTYAEETEKARAHILEAERRGAAEAEKRVAELESEVKRLQTPEYFVLEGYEEGYDTVEEVMDCESVDDFELVEILGFRQICAVWAFHDGKSTHHFPTVEEAEAAIAALATPGAQSGEGV